MTRVDLMKPDITLRLDAEGVIQDVDMADDRLIEQTRDWLGRKWSETVAVSGMQTVDRMVRDAMIAGVSAFSQVNQRLASGRELPFEYTTVRLGDNAGLIAIGRSFKLVADIETELVGTQRAMEHDYWKLREIETRYNLIFTTATDPVLFLDVDGRCVVEANPAAKEALALRRDSDFLAEIAEADHGVFRAMVRRACDDGKSPGQILHLGAANDAWMVRASRANSGSTSGLLFQLSPIRVRARQPSGSEPDGVDPLMTRLPYPFVVIDRDGVIRRANAAFLDLIEAADITTVQTENLDRWLGRTSGDLDLMLKMVRNQSVIRSFATTISNQHGRSIDVEISAGYDSRFIGLLIVQPNRVIATSAIAISAPDLIASLVDDIDTLSLHDAVEKTVGAVERHCIRAALTATEGNRKAAASLLGTSRQTLYAKLSRYGLD